MSDKPKYDNNVRSLLLDIPVPLTLGPGEATTIGYYAQLAVREIDKLQTQLSAAQARVDELENENLSLKYQLLAVTAQKRPDRPA